jgi:hypothetical protein
MMFNVTFNNNYIVAVSFIGGVNQSTQRKQLTSYKSLTEKTTDQPQVTDRENN